VSDARFRRLLPLVALAALGGSLPLALAPVVGAPAPKPRRASREIVNSIGMKLVRVPAGKFLMGSPLSEPNRDASDEGPQHEVEISQSYYMGAYEVTQEQYQKVMGQSPSFFSASGGGAARVTGLDTRNFPVEMVSWLDAGDFCVRLSALPREMAAKRIYRLPTEAEWEHACRAGAPENAPFGLGRALTSFQANFNGNSPYGSSTRGPSLNRTAVVGSYKKANLWGLYDMHGNVQEWVLDFYDKDYYRRSPKVDPEGPDNGASRVVRGGNYRSGASACRSAYRVGNTPTGRSDYIGFRVVCEIDAR
jgi:formylglycine-generating enzyme required for sulfatase activity